MLKQVAIILAAVAITACVEDTVTSSDVTKTAVEVAAAPVVETTEAAVVTEATEVKAEIETAPTAETTEAAAEAAPVVAPTAETTEAVATGSVEG